MDLKGLIEFGEQFVVIAGGVIACGWGIVKGVAFVVRWMGRVDDHSGEITRVLASAKKVGELERRVEELEGLLNVDGK